MKILFFVGSLNGVGGVERSTINLLNGLSESKNIELTLVVFDHFSNKNFKLSSNIHIVSLNISDYKKQYISIFFKLNQLLKKDFDILLTVETISLLFSFLPWFLNKNRTKLVVWEHFNFKNNNGKKVRVFLRFLAAKYADLIVLLTKRDQDEWYSNLKINAKLTYIYNINQYSLQKNSYNSSSKTILSVGRYTKVKGFDRLIKIWAILQKKYECSDWNLKIIGYGEEINNLQSMILNYKVPNISLMTTENVEQEYTGASFFCMSSYFEGLPMVLIEAQSFGLPAIAFDIFTGPSEILSVNSGILVNDNALNEYVEAIYYLISNQVVRERMSLNAFEESKHFSKKSIISKWIYELEKI